MAPETTPVAGSKRPHSSSESLPRKKQRVTHTLRHVQSRPQDVEPAPQDPIFAQGQLLKSISAALVMTGFDSATPSALEMFRSHVEEYLLRFLSQTRTSMQSNRRTSPTALDFAAALAETPNTYTASLMASHLKHQIPKDISHPSIAAPDPAPPPAPDFSRLLEPLIESRPPTWVPCHFPTLPPQHAWKQTAVFPEREQDAQKMREKATEEGMLAEQALRKLAAAAKASALQAERRRSSVLSGEGKIRESVRPQKRGVRVHEDTFANVLREMGGSDETTDMELDTAAEMRNGMDLGMPEGVMVNHDMGHWRQSRGRIGTRS